MSLDDPQMVDAIGTEALDGTIVLSIIDAWDWSDEHQHLRALQNKLNAYFAFVESKQIYEAYPDADGRALRIDIISKFQIPDACSVFLKKAADAAGELNIVITQRVR